MFSSMVQIWLWKSKNGVIVKVCILEKSEQGTKAAGCAVYTLKAVESVLSLLTVF